MSQKSDHQLRVEEFMLKAGQSIAAFPSLRTFEIRKFRAAMILEEALETIDGLGFDVVLTGGHRIVSMDCALLSDTGHVPADLIKIADGCADLKVVTTGTLSALGISDLPLQEEVDQNNLLKFGPGGHRRESDGKWIKPPGHRPPDIERVLTDQGWERSSA